MILEKRDKKWFVDLLTKRPHRLGELLYPKTNALTAHHSEWIKSWFDATDYYTLVGCREILKSASMQIAIFITMILAPNTTNFLVKKTYGETVNYIKTIKQLLDHPFTQHMVKTLYGVPLVITRCTAEVLDTNLRTAGDGTPQLTGAGLDGIKAGKHFDKVWLDDMTNEDDRISVAKREYTNMKYRQLEGSIVKDGGVVLATCNMWHKQDVESLYLKNKRLINCQNALELGIISPEKVKRAKEVHTPSEFAALYDLKHIASEDAMFTSVNYATSEELVYNGICHIDASYGGNCTTAFTIMRQEGEKIYGFGKVWKKHIDLCMPEIKMLVEKYRGGLIYVEKNADKGYLKKNLIDIGLRARDYHESMNKFTKISAYLYPKWRDIYWIKATDDEYLDQICNYTEVAELDDCADSAACLVRVLTKPAGIQFC